jgi:hypothetical protein
MAKMHKNTATRQAARIAAVLAQREAKNVVRRAAAAQQAFMVAVQQAAAQYGIPETQARAMFAPQVARTARANSATVAPSTELIVVKGEALRPCKAVWALCATLPADASRKEMLQICKDNGINSSTAATQVGLFRAAAAKAAADAAAEQEVE